MTPVDVSIVVPTRNRAKSLKRFLDSLHCLDYSDSVQLEVLVVNNGSNDETESVLVEEQARARKFLLGVLYEDQRGQSAAINRGLKECRGEIICLLDDDIVLDPHWIGALLSSYSAATEFDALQGRVLPGSDPFGNPADPEKLYYYNLPLVDYGDEIREIRGLTGVHMTFKRKVFEKVGYFDDRLGPGASGFSGDTQYSQRIRKAGFKIGYTPHAIVYHELNPERYGRGYNRMVEYRKGLSRSLYRRNSLFFDVLPNLIANCVRFWLYGVLGKKHKAYKTEGRIMRYWGYLAGRFQTFRD